MASYNRIILVGNLTKDPDVKITEAGLTICGFDIAVNDGYKKESKPLFMRVSIFGKQAENCAKFLTKGRSVLVEGRLQISEWEKDGEKKSRPEVIAQTVAFLGSNKNANSSGEEVSDNEIPF